ncbi:energy-coupling factor transport system permease protein [Microbacterium endophyticum]|uniref:Energy-coupling factor transport system permease protein n=1 Tax=Microbacterium endophyticum TaxID=1526412 RepID=A0A7W4YMR6_9MICO|nr:energy-coupling factor transporter transmembrane component T [Microbacterium endophyticum]MBB2975774.1 energy-coupling factor transport system permease protein [Microbacterium endophyticum]NIK36257.1 energy-coupling factor transport system permease protein [Microbacterium endophyticum]
MSLLELDLSASPLSRRNPIAKLAAAMVISLTLLLSIDAVSAGVSLVATLLLLPLCRIPARALWLRTWPIALGAVIAGAATVLYGRPDGQIYVEFGLLRISEGSISLALAIVLRVLAIAVPSIVLFMTTDPTDLADALAQILRLPARFVLGALAGLRLVGLLIEDWRELSLSRRARGVADTGRIRRFMGQSFALFVLAIRRGTKLATAMEARGFGAHAQRTWARPSRLHPADLGLVLIAAGVAAASVAAAVAAGTWNFILGLS